MAKSSRKKTSGARSGGSSSRKTSGGTRSNAAPRPSRQAPQPKPIRREVGAVVCLVLALVAALGYFHLDGFAINALASLMKGLLGFGYWFMPPALLLGAYILGFHRGRPVRLRLACALLFPAVMGAILHVAVAGLDNWRAVYPWSRDLMSQLWIDGLLLRCGGVLGGLLAKLISSAIHPIGAAILFVVGGILMLLTAFNRTVLQIIDYFRSRPPRAEYPPEVEEPAPVKEKEAPVRRVVSPADVDIPLDGEHPRMHVDVEAPPKKKGFFDKQRRVPTPGEFLTGGASRPPQEETPEAPKDTPPAHPFDMPVPGDPIQDPLDGADVRDTPAVPDPPVAEEAPVKSAGAPLNKVTSQEAAQAAQEVTSEIEATLEQAPPMAYQYPPVSLLEEGGAVGGSEALGELKRNQDRLADTIRSFGVEANIVNVVRGPSVTRYEMELDQGVKLSRVTNLADDIALALGAEAVRIAPIPDKISTVGIEVPNKLVSTVHIHDVIDDKAFRDHSSKVAFAVGKDIAGNAIVGNIAKLPHLLIAGTTGSGKSVCTNSLIISLLYKSTPDEVRLIMVDPKMVELGIYNGIPHLLIPVVTDPKKAAGALQWAVTEMMKRYRMFSEVGVRDLSAYNIKAAKSEDMKKLPQVVILIDELADLMLVAAKEVEESICRVAQMGRAAGMHLIVATQRPSADVITGLMKANIPSRIAFAVSSSLESRIILDQVGAEKLVGKGDMLWFPLGAGKPLRVQGTLVSDEEVAAVVDFVKKAGSADYDESVMEEIEHHAAEKDKSSKGVGGSAPDEVGDDFDELLPAAIEVVLELGQASVSMLQRRLKLGYGRAARLVDQMEEKGVVGPFEGSKPRQVLITKEQWQEMQYRQGMTPPASLPTGAAEGDEPPFDADEDEED